MGIGVGGGAGQGGQRSCRKVVDKARYKGALRRAGERRKQGLSAAYE